MYEDLQTLNRHGIDEVTGARVEISADQIRSPAIAKSGIRPIKFLSEVLEWVDAELERVRQEGADSSRAPKTKSKRLAQAATRPELKTKDGHGKIPIKATSLATSVDNEADDEPIELLSVPATPRRQRRPVLTTPNKTPSLKSRARENIEDAIAVSPSALSSLNGKENEAQADDAPKASGDIIILSSSDEESLANIVSRAGPAINRASNEVLRDNVGNNEKDAGKTKSKSMAQTRVKKKKSQNTLRQKSKVSKADNPSQEPLGDA